MGGYKDGPSLGEMGGIQMDADFIKAIHVKGERVVDRHGELIGKVSQVACDPKTYSAEWLVVKTSVLGRPRLVPIEGAIDLGDTVRVPFSKETVLTAPVPEVSIAPAMSECTALEEHYHQAA
jgi:sporulation protein YlmC with PRC-barrel domain